LEPENNFNLNHYLQCRLRIGIVTNRKQAMKHISFTIQTIEELKNGLEKTRNTRILMNV